MIIGTCHFVSIQAALRYYARQGIDNEGVAAKLDAGEIKIGPPDKLPSQRLLRIDSDTRYAIED